MASLTGVAIRSEMTSKNARKYGLSPEDVEVLKDAFKKSKRLPNPHNKGAYRFTLEALLNLGVNKFHPIGNVYAAFRKAAGAEWYEAWSKKAKRSETYGKDADERFVQNLEVLQRVRDYGKRLLEVGTQVMKTAGCVIDLKRDADGLHARLNTNSAEPMKAGRALRTASASDPEAAQAATPSSKKAAKLNARTRRTAPKAKGKGPKLPPKRRKAQKGK